MNFLSWSPAYVRSLLVTAAVLALSLLLTFIAWSGDRELGQTRERNRFQDMARDTQGAILQRMEAYILRLRSGERLITTTGSVTRRQFGTFVDAARFRKDYPGIQGIGYTVRMAPGDVAAHEAKVRSEGFPEFRVWPAGARAEYHAITFLEPFDWRNRRAFGYDMFTEATRREAMVRARDLGVPALSGKVRLVQETNVAPQAGFLVYVPVYRQGMPLATPVRRRKALLGFVYSPFRAGDLFRGVFEGRTSPPVDFEIFDGEEMSAASLLHDHDPRQKPVSVDPDSSYRPALSAVRQLDLGGHKWTLHVSAPPSFYRGQTLDQALLVALAGSLISLLLAATTFIVSTGRERALALAASMTEDLRRADSVKDEFLAVVSHELRTPLNFIMGFASVLDDGLAGPLNPKQRDFVARILGGAERMLLLVNNLLDMSQMAAGKFRLAEGSADYRNLVNEVMDTLVVVAQDKGIKLESDIQVDGKIQADPDRLVQVLTNLVGNAIKFTPSGGIVRVRALVMDGQLLTEVVDTGIGIMLEDMPKLFTRFGQLDMSSTRSAGGTGLGLSISKGIVEAHGGTIGVSSTPSEGSTFWFKLPLANQHVAPGKVEGSQRA